MLKHFEQVYWIGDEKKKGKSVLLIGGVHGNELTPLMALVLFKSLHLQGVITALEKTDEINRITIVNGINIHGLEKCTRDIIEPAKKDGSNDLNRLFKFDSYEEEFSPFQRLKELIAIHDIVIDIHSTPSMESHCMVIDHTSTAFPYIKWCQDAKVPFAIYETDATTIKRYAIENGKIGVTFELNTMDKINVESAKLGASQIAQLILKFSVETFKKSYQGVLKPLIEFKSSETGLFVFPNVFDYSGKILKNLIESQTNFNGGGVLLYTAEKSYIKKGDFAFAIQPEITITEVEEKKEENEKV